MGDILNWLLMSTPAALIANSARTTIEWLGNCFSGSCGTTPSGVVEMLTGIGDSLSSTTQYLSSAVANILLGIFQYLPDGGGFPDVIHSAFQYFGNSLATINFIFPVSTLIYCLSLVFTIKVTLWGLHVVRVGISFVRGVAVDKYEF